jgi:predicted ribosomally synthesized peptide with SipW-like signal peptide
MKKILLSLLTVGLVSVSVFGATRSVFTDTEQVLGNTFTAGSLDLKVNGQDGEITADISAENMLPGNSYDGGCVTLRNAGNLPGKVTVQVSNLVSKDNGVTEPEESDGDLAAQQIDPTGYNADTGNGELWDQITTALCFDDGTGSHTGNGHCDWDDNKVKDFSSTQDDYSSTYSISLDTDLASGVNKVLQPGDEVDFCVGVKFIDDQSNSWWGGQNGLTNNMAMGDSASMDLVFGLEQE